MPTPASTKARGLNERHAEENHTLGPWSLVLAINNEIFKAPNKNRGDAAEWSRERRQRVPNKDHTRSVTDQHKAEVAIPRTPRSHNKMGDLGHSPTHQQQQRTEMRNETRSDPTRGEHGQRAAMVNP